MRKLLIFFITFIIVSLAHAQTFNNEWIDYSKTYYKFKVGATGLYRINQSTLPSDVSSTPAQYFQLWRNGVQIPIYTSATSGALPIGGFIEFWGEKNDGKADKVLYRNSTFQLSDKISLQTDTAVFFLTINTNTSANLRYVNGTNNVAGNTLSPEPFFNYTQRFDFKEQIGRGYGENVGERVTSSSYDVGEVWGTRDIYESSPYTFSASNLFPASIVSNATITLAAAGVSYNSRSVSFKINSVPYINNQLLTDPSLSSLGYSNTALGTKTFSNNAVPLTAINNSTNNFSIEINAGGESVNRILASYVELTYARQFNFGNSNSFIFSLPASSNPLGTYIEINNFNSVANPVLYDITNNTRYVAVVSSGLIKFALPFSSVVRNFILTSQDNASIQSVTSLQSKIFTNFSLASNQANYLIVSNKLLGINTGEAVDLFRQYRASALGGGFNAKIYDIDELTDQFAFGIKKHPLSIKNFVRFAKQTFSTNPTHIFLIGKAVAYDEYRANENNAFAERLNLVPTFGWPASDVLLTSDGVNPAPLLMTGRLSVVQPSEVNTYLQKVKEYEAQQANSIQTIANKLWMKQVVHVAGSNDPAIEPLLISYLQGYENIIKDTLFGGTTANFNTQATGGGATPAVIEQLKQYFANGISILTYFGHSAATQLDYNLNSPYDYNNQGKYPMFLLNGCNAGNFFDFDTSRLSNITSFSEKFVLANQRGAIGVIASSHFGLTGYLNSFSTTLYQSIGRVSGYKNYIGKNMIEAIAPLIVSSSDFFSRMHAEQFALHGDPAIKVNTHDKPDYVVEDQTVSITPSVLSVADTKFTLKAKFYNLGKAQASRAVGGGDSLSVIIKWQHGDGTNEYLYRKFIKPSIRYGDSISIDVPIVPTRDKGNNCLTIMLDSLNQFDELSESNNVLNKCFFIFDDDAKPVFPNAFAITNKSTGKVYASTANPLAVSRQYAMEMDTTELFNSTFKISRTVTSSGGVIEFDPQITYQDSTVYYWRVAPVPTTGIYRWNNSSFVYLNGTDEGYNQSHLYQHLKSITERIKLDSFSRKWNYGMGATGFTITQGVYPFTDHDADFSIQKNGLAIIKSGCFDHSVRWSLFDAVTMKPFYNQAIPALDSSGPSLGFMGSSTANCGKQGRQFNFEFHYNSLVDRNKMRDFINWIPTGVIAIARINLDEPFDPDPVSIWKTDATSNGSLANTLYGKLIATGFTSLDSFNYPRPWVYMFQKNAPTFTPKWKFGYNTAEVAHLDVTVASNDTLGFITSPVLGPAKTWKLLKWRGASSEIVAGDIPTIDIVGVTNAGVETILFTNVNITQQDFNLTSINAITYPYLKLKMSNKDAVNLTPYQLRYWRLIADMVPEGAIAPNIKYTFKDTLESGEKLNFAVAFKNISSQNFTDSIKVKMQVFNNSNVINSITTAKLKKPLIPGDTATVIASIPTESLTGNNTLFVDINPEFDQPEQAHFNNFLYKNFYVNTDKVNPIVDVTFDGVHILNGDIVSAKPGIRINLKDESKYLALSDTAGVTIQLRYPDNTVKRFRYGTDTLRFTPATINGNNNIAVADFTPSLSQDGEYELFVKGKDMSGNNAGNQEYRVTFNVNNTPAISEVFNYPNPFTSSTAFVFTLTGTKLPSNIRIQILTVTGKIIREINKDELGPLHIGRNITDFKWDGTDMYGQKLANGVYLYRVITNLDGNSLEKFYLKDSNGDKIKTDKFFKGGYGKMYLMR
jgi:hypothetical protein